MRPNPFNLPLWLSAKALLDETGKQCLALLSVASPVNWLIARNSATGNRPAIVADGSDTNIGIDLVPKVTGTATVNGSAIIAANSSGTTDANARARVSLEGALVGTRREINFLTGTDVSLSVTDDSGNERVDVEVSSTARSWTAIARLSSNVTTTSASAGDVTGLSFSIGASQVWAFDFNILSQCSTANGHKWALDIPTGCTVAANLAGSRAQVASIISDTIAADDTLSVTLGTGTYTSGGWVNIKGVVVNSTNAGTVQLRFASATGGDTTTAKAGSYVLAHRIA